MLKLLPLLLMYSCSFFGIQNEESPKYKVIVSDGPFEIRAYKPYIIAKTTVEGNYKEASSKAFRKLAGYIFGKNLTNKSISMTSPVQIKDSSEQIKMTAPVQIKKEAKKSYTMSFFMPSKYTLKTIPRPSDDSISFEQVETKIIAAIRFTWLVSEKRNKQKEKELRKWLKTQNEYTPVDGYVFAGHNPPWTIPFLRRNEILIELK